MDRLVDNEEFLLLLTSHQRRLLGYLRALVPIRDDAEEVLQEVNLYLCRHWDEFQLGTDFAAWALKVAHFCVLKWRDRQSRDRLVFDDTLLERMAVSAEALLLQDDHRRAALETCLEKLSARDHDLITQLYDDPEATPQSLADRFGRSAKGIYESLSRIRLNLLDCVRRTLASEERSQ